MAEADQSPIERLTFFDKTELVGARWWQPSVSDEGDTNTPGRRKALLILGALVAAPLAVAVVNHLSDDSATDQIRPSTDLQRENGWDVGSAGRKLDWADANITDVDGSVDWQKHVKTLASDLAPPPPLLLPWALPTLLQMPSLPINASLANQIMPICDSSDMPDAWQVGRALVGQLGVVPGAHSDLMVVVDLPGPKSISVAAALSDAMTPVFILDNCPHPAGVVPAHRTLGALLYLLPRFLAGPSVRPAGAPPVLVLDSARLSPYSDAPDQFDNRYLARMPSPAQLREVGVAHVLYVGMSTDVLDDLVDSFDAWVKAGIDIRMVQYGDFTPTTSTTGEPNFGPGRRAWFGGTAESDAGFWYNYGWYQPTVPRPLGWVARPSGLWRFRWRSSVFGSNLGRVHTIRWGGGLGSSGRSGSWTRTGGSSFG